jgi:hypothetical protein
MSLFQQGLEIDLKRCVSPMLSAHSLARFFDKIAPALILPALMLVVGSAFTTVAGI